MNLSRLKVASYLADNLSPQERPAAIRRVAAWLLSSRRRGQADNIARDVAAALEQEGYLYATVTSARPLTNDARTKITQFLSQAGTVNQVELIEAVDPLLISGLQIQTPSKQLDATGSTQLGQFVRKATQ